MKISYPTVNTFLDYPDNESHSVVICTTECDHNCKDCHSLDKIKCSNQIDISINDLIVIIKNELKKLNSNKLCIEGGDPLHSSTINEVKDLLNKLSDVDICLYTGYDINYVKKNDVTGFKFLKTGTYNFNLKQKSEKTNEYISFASTNQKLYDNNFKLLSKNGKYYF